MKVSCARSSASSRSRTMRKISEKTGRSYRRISSRKRRFAPLLGERDDVGIGKIGEVEGWGSGHRPSGARSTSADVPRRGSPQDYPAVRQTSRVALDSPSAPPAPFDDARQ